MNLESVKYVKGYNTNVLSWNEILDNFNESKLMGEDIKHICPTFFVSHSAHRIENLKPILDNLNCNEAHTYINLSGFDKTFGKHKDTMDVWFWQVQGKTKWEFDGGMSYVLSPGDLLEVPKGVWHNVTALSPRCGISMSRV